MLDLANGRRHGIVEELEHVPTHLIRSVELRLEQVRLIVFTQFRPESGIVENRERMSSNPDRLSWNDPTGGPPLFSPVRSGLARQIDAKHATREQLQIGVPEADVRTVERDVGPLGVAHDGIRLRKLHHANFGTQFGTMFRTPRR
jgi:hypothetical protein